MKAAYHTDYALRLLIYLLTHPEGIVGTRVVAEVYGVSPNHMNKVSQHLVKLGLLNGTRGRGGGGSSQRWHANGAWVTWCGSYTT